VLEKRKIFNTLLELFDPRVIPNIYSKAVWLTSDVVDNHQQVAQNKATSATHWRSYHTWIQV